MKKIIVLLMIGLLLFSISACSESVTSNGTSDTAQTESTETVDTSTGQTVSSENTDSSQPGVNDFGTVIPSESSKLNAPDSTIKADISGIPKFVDGVILMVLTTDATERYTDYSAEALSQNLGIEITSVESILAFNDLDDPESREYKIIELHVPQRGESELSKIITKLQKHEDVKGASLNYTTFLQ